MDARSIGHEEVLVQSGIIPNVVSLWCATIQPAGRARGRLGNSCRRDLRKTQTTWRPNVRVSSHARSRARIAYNGNVGPQRRRFGAPANWLRIELDEKRKTTTGQLLSPTITTRPTWRADQISGAPNHFNIQVVVIDDASTDNSTRLSARLWRSWLIPVSVTSVLKQIVARWARSGEDRRTGDAVPVLPGFRRCLVREFHRVSSRGTHEHRFPCRITYCDSHFINGNSELVASTAWWFEAATIPRTALFVRKSYPYRYQGGASRIPRPIRRWWCTQSGHRPGRPIAPRR